MAEKILCNGDQVIFEPLFEQAQIIGNLSTNIIAGSTEIVIAGAACCIEGDEEKVIITAQYVTPAYSVPGTCSIKIKKLSVCQLSENFKKKGKSVLLANGDFTAVMEVLQPAQSPPPASSPDTVSSYSGKGRFITSNSIGFA